MTEADRAFRPTAPSAASASSSGFRSRGSSIASALIGAVRRSSGGGIRLSRSPPRGDRAARPAERPPEPPAVQVFARFSSESDGAGRPVSAPGGRPEPLRLGVPDRHRDTDRHPAPCSGAFPSRRRCSSSFPSSRSSRIDGKAVRERGAPRPGLRRELLLHELPVDLPGDHARDDPPPGRVRAERGQTAIRLGVDQRGPRARHAARSSPTTARRSGSIPRRWTLLTGDPEQVRRLVVDGIQDPRRRRACGWRRADGHRPHRESSCCVDGAGRVRGYYGIGRDGTRRGVQPRPTRAAGSGERKAARVDYALFAGAECHPGIAPASFW